MKVKMEGLQELQAKLARFAQTESEQIENKALTEAADFLRGKIEETTPYRTGALQEAIIAGEVNNGKIEVGPSQQGPAFRAHFLEFGTRYMRAQPFMRPAFESSKNEVMKIMADEIKRGMGI